HQAGVIEAEHALGRFAGARRIDDIGGRGFANQAMQPGALAADVPTGFVEHGPGGFLDGFTDARVDRLTALGRTQDDMGAAAARQANAEEGLEDAADFAMRHAGLLVEFNDGGLGVGSELSGGGPECIGRLQGMSALHPAAAFFAAADVNVELAMNRPTRNLDLILLVDMRFLDVAAAVGTR